MSGQHVLPDRLHPFPVKKQIWLGLGIMVVIVGFIAAALLLWRIWARGVYDDATRAYIAGDCQTALPLYDKIVRQPTGLGDFIDKARDKAQECQAFVEADSPDHALSIRQYETFNEQYPGILRSGALAHIDQHYLAWGVDLRQANQFEEAVAIYHQWMSDYPAATEPAQNEILAAYMEWGDSQRHENQFREAVTAYDQLISAYPLFKSAGVEQIRQTYLEWGGDERKQGNFQEAIVIYDELADRYPAFDPIVNTELLTTYLAWNDSLYQVGDFAGSIAVLDLFAVRSEQFAAAAYGPSVQSLLDWGADQFHSAHYVEAEQVYRQLLQRELDRLPPLVIPASGWSGVWPHPYALAQFDLAEVNGLFYAGPGEMYAPSADNQYPRRGIGFFALVGTSPDGQWYALEFRQEMDVDDQASLVTVRDVPWPRQDTLVVGWLPAAAAELVLTSNYDAPMAAALLQALVVESDPAAQAVAGLQKVYAAWGETALASEELNAAATAYIALATLTQDQTIRQDAWSQLAHIHLLTAQNLAAAGEYPQSIGYTLMVEDFAVAGEFTLPARILQVNNWLNLGDRDAARQDWAAAVACYENVLTIEQSTFAPHWVTVTEEQAFLYETVTSPSEQWTAEGQQFPVLARHNAGGVTWVLILAPTFSSSQAWLPANQARFSFPLTDLPAFAELELPALQSHAAMVKLAYAHKSWAAAYQAVGAYDEALAHYQIIMDDAALAFTIPDAPELASQAWTAWGDLLLSQNQRTEAVSRYLQALAVAPDSPGAMDADAALTALLDTVVAEVTAGSGCEAVLVLDMYLSTPRATPAQQALPQALYQCGAEQLQVTKFDEAGEAFQRVLDQFSASSYAAPSRRGLQAVAWGTLVRDVGIAAATTQVCNEAGANVQAGVSTLTKPHIVYVNGFSQVQDALPASLKGTAIKTTVVICIDPVQETRIERCSYYLPGSRNPDAYIERYRYSQTIRMVDPMARLTVARETLYGTYPTACPSSVFLATGEVRRYTGDRPTAANFVTWVQQRLPAN